ncbi:nitroreductase family protein [Candidatus Bathyarchaeota archaeon]|nr:nitroreductase family protein [Candidatus Bathyarchaeota archaeon]
MLLDEAIKGRRSIRSFQDKTVPLEIVREVIEAGIWAPSTKNEQPWRFTVLTGESKDGFITFFRSNLEVLSKKIGLAQMGSSFESCRVMEAASMLIIVWNAGRHGWLSEEHSVAAAIQNMLLKAYSLGLGSLWIADVHYLREEIVRYFSKTWGLTAAVAIGWPSSKLKPRQRLSVDEVSEFLS